MICRKIVLILIMVSIVFTCSVCMAENTEICDGIFLGMTRDEVIKAYINNGKPIYDSGIYETTVAEQPYSIVQLFFVEDISSFIPVEYADIRAWTAASVMNITIDVLIKDISRGFVGVMEAHEKGNWTLAQARVYITSDYKYETAQETFQNVENFLSEQYGETRYTSRRGESLPMVKAYGVDTYLIVSQDIQGITDMPAYMTVPDYSQRILKLDDGRFMVIDHNISFVRNDSEYKFIHNLIFSLIPVDISDPRNLLDAAIYEKLNTTPEPTTVPTPAPTEIVTNTPKQAVVLTPDVELESEDPLSYEMINHYGKTKSGITIFFYEKCLTTSKKIGKLDNGIPVYIIAETENYLGQKWYLVDVDGQRGFIVISTVDILSQEESDQYRAANSMPFFDSVPEDVDKSLPKITDDTILYYNPNGGKTYHLDPNCKTISYKYTPLDGQFYYVQINDPLYSELQPCNVCNAPLRPEAEILETDDKYISIPVTTEIIDALERGSLDEGIRLFSEFYESSEGETFFQSNEQVSFQMTQDAWNQLQTAHEFEMNHLTDLLQEHKTALRNAEASLLRYMLAEHQEANTLTTYMTVLTQALAGIY